ncbi:MAG: UvrD-helicase domain-containing protein [Chloroflexi bacterium]|nr:UvrD-helicase domain-containing protein [Chloroflexota bacterium]
MTTAELVDQDQRIRLRTEIDATFFVEAGAGTGKTQELVARIVELVAAGRVRMEALAAITFTEAAAAELRDRVRQGLEEGSTDDGRPEVARARCAAASGEVDLAAIQTIHSFAGTLLRTFPLEAGLPPGFATWDQVQRDLAFEERFRAWLYDQVPAAQAAQATPTATTGGGAARGPAAPREEPPLRATVRRVLAMGMTPDDLSGLAARMLDYYDLLDAGTQWNAGAGADPTATARTIAAELAGLTELLPLAKLGDADPLVQEVVRIQRVAREMAVTGDADEAYRALSQFEAQKPRLTIGRQGDWRKDAGGENPVAVIRQAFRDVRAAAEAAQADWRTAAFAALLEHLRDFTLEYAAERKRMGVATFHDLLTWARDLLRDRPEARKRAAARFERIFVDEFQDTDPLQAEIAWFLAADPTQTQERDWRKLTLVPGKLFLVGDPKQSIYRFRRADIGLYQLIYEQLAEPAWHVALAQNFRSVAPVLRWVNYQLGRDMTAEAGIQAPYRDLFSRPANPSLDQADDACGVYHVGELLEDGGAPAAAFEEARAVARAARSIQGAWLVASEADGGGRALRPARYGDICVLLRARTNLRRIERAFERQGVPYRIEGGSLVLASQEVQDLLACLRAIDDPSDQVALVAALRSPAYACSDANLLEWVGAGGALNYMHPVPDGGGSVREAFTSLAALHEARTERSAAATIEAFIRERMLAVQAFGQPRPREAWRRLRYVAGQARSLAARGRPTLRLLLDWLETLQARSEYDPESPGPEGDEDAVRVMTIHGAKGLEFPVVLLTGLGMVGRGPNSTDFVADYRTERLEACCSKSDVKFATSGYDRTREERVLQAEALRLLYVGATRAREHLVLCLFHSERNRKSCHAARILQALDEAPEPLSRLLNLADGAAAPESINAWTTADAHEEARSAEEHERAELTWMAAREKRIRALASERVWTPTGLGRRASWAAPQDEASVPVAEESDWDIFQSEEVPEAAPAAENEGDGPLRAPARAATAGPGQSAKAIGSAVHAVLQTMDLETRADVDALVDQVSERFGVGESRDEVKRLTLAAAGSEPVRRAVDTGRYWREVPLGTSAGGSLLEGVADLLFEYADGTVGIIDYKTDHEDTAAGARASQHRMEGGAYALAVQAATGRKVHSVEFVFAAHAGATVAYRGDQVDALIAAASRALGVVAPISPASATGGRDEHLESVIGGWIQ